MIGLGIMLAFTGLMALDPRKAVTQYIHDVWQTADGLPQNTVKAITQTKDGYLWLGTLEGLVRFDGVRFTIFDTQNTPALKSNRIEALLAGRDGRLWIGTYGGGLCQLADGMFRSFSSRDGLASNFVISLAEDHAGNIWIGTRSEGLIRYQNGSFTAFTSKDGLAGDAIQSICEDRKKVLWIGTTRGLNRLVDGKFSTFSVTNGLSNDNISAILEDRTGTLWIGTASGEIDGYKDGKFFNYKKSRKGEADRISALLLDQENVLWAGSTGQGVCRIIGGQPSFFKKEQGLSADIIYSLCEDREGNLWIGTNGGGLNRLRDGNIVTYTTREGLSENIVTSIFEDHAGNFWIGTQGGGLNRLQGGHVRVFTRKEGLSNDWAISIYEDQEGSIWIGTAGGGLNRYQNGRFAHFGSQDGLSDNTILSIIEDQRGVLWIGGDNGLTQFQNSRFNAIEEMSGNGIISIFEDRRENLWFGTIDKGLIQLKEGKFIRFGQQDGLAKDHIVVRMIYEDEAGVLWIGTNGDGLFRYKDGRFFNFSVRQGLFDNAVHHVFEDKRGNLWMSCNKGIFRIRKQELNDVAEGKSARVRAVSYDTGDGMKNRECNGGTQPSACKTRDGRIWFPTMGGVVVVNPDDLKINSLPPPVVIESVLINKKSMSPIKAAAMPPGIGELEFHFTALSFVSSQKIRFKYMLEGFDAEWIDAATRRDAYYTNIPPGKYSFRVIACNKDGIWNSAGAQFDFYLQPFFYQTPWFWGACALILAFLLLGSFRWRIGQLKARERHLTLLVEERTKELELANQELERLSLTDKLTNIANRRNFENFLDSEWKRCAREGKPLSLIMGDIDNFKAYNDSYGHPAGDECLRKIAHVLKKNVNRAGDMAARYGGEEFIIILPATGAEGAAAVAKRIRAGVEALRIAHKASPGNEHVTISLGCATCIPDRKVGSSSLIQLADQALYQSKLGGRNRISTAPISK